ncbi:putative serine/threonine-protein kinase ULK3, partial [Apostichopus japonicus]
MASSTASRLANFPEVPGFVLTEKLGSGSYATVYKAFRKGPVREVVAIKCIAKSGLTKSTTENLLKEIEIMKTVHHEFIVELKNFVWDDDFIFLIMEFCNGGDLSLFIRKRQALPEQTVKMFLQQLASALQYLHQRHITHMDLKPQNLLLCTADRPMLKVGDFGFAQHLAQEETIDSLRGSPLYMAPEILCERRYSAKVDLWSAGVIMYECLFGEAPYASRTYAELAEKISSQKPIEIPTAIAISDNCRDLLVRLLQRDPNDRIDFEAFFSHPFIDLEHMPSEESLKKAKALVFEAVKCDNAGKWKNAIELYTKSLRYFLPAIQYERNEKIKDVLRKKVQEYMQRAEQIKQMMKPSSPTGTAVTEPPDNANNPYIYSHSKEDYDNAFFLYQDCLEQLMSVLQNEKPGKRKDLLKDEVTQIMKRAEEVKQYLE